MNKKLAIYTLFIVTIFSVAGLGAEETRKMNFAVLGLKNGTGVTSGETDILADRLRVNLFRTGKVIMMERSQMDEILKEQGFQASGACNDAECAVEMGQMLGVERVIGGSIGKLGNLFLVNLRVIDVQTAKILMVVSKDISGGIEGVVKVLPGLAEDLVKDPKGSGAPVTVKPVAPVVEEKPKEVELEPTPEVITKSESTDESFVASSSAKKTVSGKNKNKGGVRFSYSLFPGKNFKYYYYDEDYNSYEESDGLKKEEVEAMVDDNPLYSALDHKEFYYRVNLAFMIPVGKYIAIDVGPSFAYYKKQFSYAYKSSLTLADTLGRWDWRLKILSPNVSLGLNFTKRIHPLKINAGFVVDVNFNVTSYKREDDKSVWNSFTYYDYTDTYQDMSFAVNASFGPRLGVELLLGKKLGISVDYLFKYNKIGSDIDFISSYDQQWKFKMPTSAFMFGINLYK